jgi:hypothetical protein
MVDLCTLTGIMNRPDGTPFANGELVLVPDPVAVVAVGTAVSVPTRTVVTTGADGSTTIILRPGTYNGQGIAPGERFGFLLGVPDVASADLEEWLGLDVEVQTSAQMARDAALAAQAEATSQAGIAADAAADAQAALNAISDSAVARRSTRAAVIAMAAVFSIGTIVQVGSVQWQKDGVSTVISDMTGWKPVLPATPQHFANVVGDGVVDDTLACNAALAAGPRVHFPRPAVRYRITDHLNILNDNVEVTGEMSEIRQITPSRHNIRVYGDNVRISGLHLWGNGVRTNQFSDSNLYLLACKRAVVTKCLFENHRGAAVLGVDALDCLVTVNTFANSTASATVDVDGFADVAFLKGSQGNVVSWNLMNSGQRVGVLVQASEAGDHCDDNKVLYNMIKAVNAYGVAAYRADELAVDQSVFRTQIIGNTVLGVTGSVINFFTGTNTYGAAYYTQGAEDSKIHDNYSEDTHTADVPFDTLLGPGAIACVNQSRVSIKGNTCRTGGMNGIVVRDDADRGVPNGHVIVEGNDVTDFVLSSLWLTPKSRVTIKGNNFDGAGRSNIDVAGSEPEMILIIDGNVCLNTGGVANIEVRDTTAANINGNICDTSATHGISLVNCPDAVVGNNNIRNHTVRGLVIGAGSTNANLTGNSVIGDGTSAVGFRLDEKVSQIGNRARGCVVQYEGAFAWLMGVRSGVQVNSIGAAETNLFSQSIAANTMTENGDRLRFDCAGLAANNANAKTVRVYFGATLIGTFVLPVNQASSWDLDIKIFRRGLNAQRCRVRFTQGGTIERSTVVITDAAETETATILFRVTGQATTNNDVQVRMADLEWDAA